MNNKVAKGEWQINPDQKFHILLQSKGRSEKWQPKLFAKNDNECFEAEGTVWFFVQKQVSRPL